MTASTTLPASDPSAEPHTAALAWLDDALRQRVEAAAAHAGLSPAEACERWLLQGLEKAEQQLALSESAGRCSLRTGTCTTGPVPLPVQQ